MQDLSTTAKGAIAECAITTAAVKLGIVVLRPVVEGRRYDLVFDHPDGRLERVQCKWGRLEGDIIAVRTSTCRHTPTNGYVRTTYDTNEVDAFVVYCGELDECFYLPVSMVDGKSYVHLRLKPTRNNQRSGVTMAADHRFGAVAQLGERSAGSRKVRGSIPLSST